MTTRRTFALGLIGLTASGAAAAFGVRPQWRQAATAFVTAPVASPPDGNADTFARPEIWAQKLVSAAESQIGKTLWYDAAYTSIGYPNGDVPLKRGVCTDVIIRAYRGGLGVDLQKLVHEDMAANFSAYPQKWGLKTADSNIDHRRVPNLQTYFKRMGASLPLASEASAYLPGDVVTMNLPGRLTHIALVTGRASQDGARPLCVHNIGAGARLGDALFAFELTGHFRFMPKHRQA